ncbi:hypothetical protein ACI01nite_24700 [Acetobacter cibinongensis]|uniref:Hedgehog/Intein (Hint) domain-containing protein n=1 Tax=Acetobacter cibinongensis TaxID=146475 RepID=A0A0D6N7I9_9PROT|nr:Hint domain-containing protein [Acetobacter cibinongensis]GAN61660.1 hypothetical protein Abci_053_014 [Acetobacter cibinongensis]GEL59868.1 hypothetical protein ACI01nite_24700 [Acetobacter cibinongensis]
MTCLLLWWWLNSLKRPATKPASPKPNPCYLAGTQISTPSGLKNVENLAFNDDVIIYENGSYTHRRLSWVGRFHINVDTSLPDDLAGYPVRVVKNALADGIPSNDLLITAEHCLFFDGKFIPVRMLVNGRSIFYDKTFTSYDYYHLETTQHSVLVANNTLSESYLNTGGHTDFLQDKNVFYINRRLKTWEGDAAAPLATSLDIVEPLYRSLEHRAEELQIGVKPEPLDLIHDANIQLTTGDGKTIKPIRHTGNRVMFMVPGSLETVLISSHTSRPCDTVGPFVDDRRELGVLVGEITLLENKENILLAEHFQAEELQGWSVLEHSEMRWTTGAAVLHLGKRARHHLGLLVITVRAGGPYLRRNQHAETLSAQYKS